jgi:PPOX class probable F420-dependent enzyme
VEDTVWTAVDAKPKSTRSLRRLANIESNPRVTILVDQYEDDWSALWWVRVDGDAMVVPADAEDGQVGLSALVAKYPQYVTEAPAGPLIRVAITDWTSWSAR